MITHDHVMRIFHTERRYIQIRKWTLSWISCTIDLEILHAEDTTVITAAITHYAKNRVKMLEKLKRDATYKNTIKTTWLELIEGFAYPFFCFGTLGYAVANVSKFKFFRPASFHVVLKFLICYIDKLAINVEPANTKYDVEKNIKNNK
jgi:hypothetical protein